MQIPSPGADCPAIVRSPLLIFKGLFNRIRPEILKSIVLAPFCLIAHRSVPGSSLSSSEVTYITLPPLPPVVYIPAPSAPGKAGIGDTKEASVAAFAFEKSIATIKIKVIFNVFFC